MSKKKIEEVIITITNTDDISAGVKITTNPPFDPNTEEAEDTPNVVLATAIMNFLQDENEEEDFEVGMVH